jgi:hypothetical protein
MPQSCSRYCILGKKLKINPDALRGFARRLAFFRATTDSALTARTLA